MRPFPAAPVGRIGPWALLLFAGGLGIGCDEPVRPNNVRRVELYVLSLQLRPGYEVQATATPVDANGYLVESPQVKWRSLTPNTIAVNDDGLVRALAPGIGLIRASVGSVSAHLQFTLVNPPIASISLDAETLLLSLPGGTRTLTATPLDADGIAIIGAPLSWSSSASRIATVTATGFVTANAVGSARIAVRGEVVERAVAVSVEAPPSPTSPVITGIAPSVALPGSPLIVNGTGFSGNASANTVLIDGTAVPITAASATQLVLALPPAANWPCEPSRTVALQVTSPGGIGVSPVMLQVAAQRALAVGQAAELTSLADARCNEFTPATARYLITVPNAARSLGSGTMALSLRGTMLSSPGSAAATAALVSLRTPRPTVPSRSSRRDAIHGRLLEANRAVAAAGSLTIQRRVAPRQANATAPAIGSIVPVRVPSLDQPNFCSNFTPIGARTVYSGTKVVLLEDTIPIFGGAPTLAGQMDAEYQALGAELDGTVWPILETFGNALVMDSRLDDNGRILLVFSPRVNAFFSGAVMAAVVNCDFFSRAQFASSNVGEYVYAQVPTSLEAGFGAGTRTRWMHEIRGTLAHEMKHVTAYAERIVRGQPLEEPWLEEATARHAEELFARAVYGRARFGNDGVTATLECELRAGDPAFPACAGKPRAMRPHAEALWSFLDDPTARSPLGPTAPGDATYYGSAWSLTRWLIDQESLAEPAFFTALTTSGLSGIENLQARTGRTWDEIVTQWSLTLATDDRLGMTPTSLRLRFPSWNLASLFKGLCDLAGTCGDPGRVSPFVREHPLRAPQLLQSEFLVEVPSVAPGGFAVFELQVSGGISRQLLELRGFRGAALPSTARLGILRIE